MNDSVTKEIEQQFEALPPVLKSFIAQQGWIARVEAVAGKYGLNEIQTEGLRQEVFFILLGLTQSSDFRANLVEELDITYDQALKISYDMNAQVFGLVLKELTEIQNGISENQIPSTPAEESVRPEAASPFLPSISKSGVEESVYKLMDHKEMERVDGPHLHSQNIMPQTEDAPKSIVDQKLSRIFKSSSAPSNLPTGSGSKTQSGGYNGADPYREPIN